MYHQILVHTSAPPHTHTHMHASCTHSLTHAHDYISAFTGAEQRPAWHPAPCQQVAACAAPMLSVHSGGLLHRQRPRLTQAEKAAGPSHGGAQVGTILGGKEGGEEGGHMNRGRGMGEGTIWCAPQGDVALWTRPVPHASCSACCCRLLAAKTVQRCACPGGPHRVTTSPTPFPDSPCPDPLLWFRTFAGSPT